MHMNWISIVSPTIVWWSTGEAPSPNNYLIPTPSVSSRPCQQNPPMNMRELIIRDWRREHWPALPYVLKPRNVELHPSLHRPNLITKHRHGSEIPCTHGHTVNRSRVLSALHCWQLSKCTCSTGKHRVNQGIALLWGFSCKLTKAPLTYSHVEIR